MADALNKMAKDEGDTSIFCGLIRSRPWQLLRGIQEPNLQEAWTRSNRPSRPIAMLWEFLIPPLHIAQMA